MSCDVIIMNALRAWLKHYHCDFKSISERNIDPSYMVFELVNHVCDVTGCGLQVVGSRVVVCRDAAAGACRRAACRYYHIPVQLPPALRPP